MEDKKLLDPLISRIWWIYQGDGQLMERFRSGLQVWLQSLAIYIQTFFPEVGLVIVKAPLLKILEIVNGPSFLDFSFPGKSLSLEF